MASTRRTDNSPPDQAVVSRLITLRWGWKPARCELWNRGVSDTYSVEHKGRRAYLKVYRRDWRSRAEIQGEIDLVRYLRRMKIRVADPIPNCTGEFMDHLEAPDGRRYAVLFSEAKGAMPAFNGENSRKYGLLAAAIHDVTDARYLRFRRPHLGIGSLAREPIDRLRLSLSPRSQELTYLKGVTGDLAQAVAALLPASLPEYGVCHGDLTFGNVRRDHRGRLTLFDFDYAVYGWRACDVAVFLLTRGFSFSRRANTDRMKQWNAFMEGYHTVRRLSDNELEAVNLFVPLRLIWQMGMLAKRPGETQKQPNRQAVFESQLAFIRGWLKIHKLL